MIEHLKSIVYYDFNGPLLKSEHEQRLYRS
jgi:hypothetical protein